MERREKIQGFIKKHIILKKRKPTDSIFAEKRSAVAITFALMIPVFFAMFTIAIDTAYLYYSEEVLSMALDAAGTFLAPAGYSTALNSGGGSYLYQNVQIALVGGFCQYPATSLNQCGVNWGGETALTPAGVSNWRWTQINPNYGVIQANGKIYGILEDLLGDINISYGSITSLNATSVVRFIQ